MVVMRAYSRNRGPQLGWKGLTNDPDMDGTFDVVRGIRTARQVLLDIADLGVAAVVARLSARPDSASTPVCTFIPKYHWLPVLVWCIAGSRSPFAFFVDLGRSPAGRLESAEY